MVTQATRFPIVDRVEEEALDLLVEARNYLAYGIDRDLTGYAPYDRLEIWAEAFRLTSRLAWVVSWAAGRHAADAGEKGIEDPELDDPRWVDILTGQDDLPPISMPAALERLLARSLNLLSRARRLDHPPSPPPVSHDTGVWRV